jgi:exosortase D (VPLPA-CTERM-specific)
MNNEGIQRFTGWKPALIGAALIFMYSTVLWKLVYDWWTDDNYSHGLIVPFLIAYIIWQRKGRIASLGASPNTVVGLLLVVAAAVLLLGGTLASVLVAQRISLVTMLIGVILYFYGLKVLRKLAIPFALLILAIPIPQMLFNKFAFPLQLLASRIAERGLVVLSVPVERLGNLIEIPFSGTGEIISLEVVEACSGIRSLMTLITLALVLGYFTRDGRRPGTTFREVLSDKDVVRTLLLMISAVPIALITNAGRVMITGLLAHHYGQASIEGTWHDVSGAVVFVSALALLMGLNSLLRLLLRSGGASEVYETGTSAKVATTRFETGRVALIFAVVIACGTMVNWFQYRGEVEVQRLPLSEIPAVLGGWEQRNPDIRFDPESEKVLKATDYVMRDYYGPGKRLNLYVGYYASQRGGTTYHSPMSCLPGTGWELEDPQVLEIQSPSGKRFQVNRYVIRQGDYKEFLIYWYQGRGRTFTNEYLDKFYTSLDSVTRRRSDGAMVRIMTPIGKDAERSLAAAIDLTGHAADNLDAFLPK